VEDAWRALLRRYPALVLDSFQIMPNHFHGVIVIPGPGLEPSLAVMTGAPVIQAPVGPRLASARRGRAGVYPGQGKADASVGPTKPVGLGEVIGAFKSLSALAVNRALRRSGKLWQEDYYEHVIRNPKELGQTREYITNPARWQEDPENPDL
ncbi:MAG: transposase, partial [Burkholderiales bacterium]